jgi:hypothetical protein
MVEQENRQSMIGNGLRSDRYDIPPKYCRKMIGLAKKQF